jgi:hypothetical protein
MGEVITTFNLRRAAQLFAEIFHKLGHAAAEEWAKARFTDPEERYSIKPYLAAAFKKYKIRYTPSDPVPPNAPADAG